MRVLYVEDDLRDADLAARTLRKVAPSFEMEHATTIEAAFERLIERLPSTARSLRREGRHRHL